MKSLPILLTLLLCATAPADTPLKQSTPVTVKLGPFIDSTDGVTAETALTISQADVRVAKGGGDYAQKNESSAATHDELGEYDVDLDATDTNTLGPLRVMVQEAGSLPVWRDFVVLPANVYDSFYGADKLEVDVVSGGSGSADFVTTIDSLTNQTTFSVAAAAADDDALIGWSVLITDQSTGNQVALGVISDYTASGADIVLEADPGLFTIAVGDTVEIFRPQTVAGTVTVEGTVDATLVGTPSVNLTQIAGTVISESSGGRIAGNFSTFFNNGNQASAQTQDDVGGGGAGLTAAAVADAVWTEVLSAHTATAGGAAQIVNDVLTDTGTTLPGTLATISSGLTNVDGDVANVLADTNELQSDWADGGRLDLLLDAAGGSGGASASAIADAVLDEALSGHVTAGSLGAAITAIQNQSDVAAAMQAIHLDHLFAADYDPSSKPGAATALLNELIWNKSGVSRMNANVTDINEVEVTGGSGVPWSNE